MHERSGAPHPGPDTGSDRGDDAARDGEHLPAWLRRTAGEQRLPVALAVSAAIAFQALLPNRLQLVPRYGLLIPEVLLLVVILAGDPLRMSRDSAVLRRLGLALTALVSLANTVSAALLVHALVTDHTALSNASDLLTSGVLVYLTNIVGFALWYWEFDRGGARARANGTHRYPDLLFPQMTTPHVSDPDWEPTFFDYFYVSFTNATAFSPTDTMPMTHWAKALMLVQSAVALAVVGLVIARAVNVLG